MRIDRLIMTGFGRFQGRTLELEPGLNILYGPNEAGKTTVQKFILGMLYGFKKRGQRRDYTEDAAR
ncbi:MAG: double-strand break repair Rad50 ATPase, partial [Firmicutes bacterium]|nr:double-strand break repair Rad50 ATPase [Bacillota bacterium]